MDKTIIMKRNKVSLIILLSIFIFSAFFLNSLNVSACFFGFCNTGDVGCCGSRCCNVDYGSCGGNSCAPATTTTTTTQPSTTTTTSGGSGNCLCLKSNGGRYCWDTINNKSCSGCACEWSCSQSPLGCYPSNGGYLWQSDCNNNCYVGYNCNSGGLCQVAFQGTYKTLSGCQACCGQPCSSATYYSCNTSTWTCSENSNGSYSSLTTCNNNCNPPSNGTTTTTSSNGTTTTTGAATTTTISSPESQPCMINYFELPLKAWVGYSITGRWSASDWCDDCDVDCTPYPECVWKQDSIGIGDIGSNEYELTLEQSGTYNYTLTCYGPGGIDERTEPVTVKAFNLPWWQEIIPVLQGFLRGIWG